MKIAVIGAGPSGLFIFKKLVESGITPVEIDIYEKHSMPGAGMPYSEHGARVEHVTNVSANEIPQIATPVHEWIKTVDAGLLKRFGIDAHEFNEYKVLPRLLFGEYLNAQFKIVERSAKSLHIPFKVFYNHDVDDIRDNADTRKVEVYIKDSCTLYDKVIICTGHSWPLRNEKLVPGFFDSPYPPSKLAFRTNHPVAIKGASLTAIDAIKTLARENGEFLFEEGGNMQYILHPESPDFRLVMHSLGGYLPAVRFHLDDSMLGKDTGLTPTEILANRKENDGFLSLDYVFDKNFKELLRDKQPAFYEKIRDMSIEEFVDMMMNVRERIDAFELLKKEFDAAEKSIDEEKSIYWKEMLAVLSFTMNYPAKYFSAEDMLRLQKTLMPLISIIIAFIPQSSARELMALHDAGILSLVSVDSNSYVESRDLGGITYHYTDEGGTKHSVDYQTFVDCVGQPRLSFEDFPYKGLQHNRTVSPATIRFRDRSIGKRLSDGGDERVSKDSLGNYYLRVPGIAINDHFQIVDDYNAYNDRIFVMAVPLIGGYNPDYSGLDFCEAASSIIVSRLANTDI